PTRKPSLTPRVIATKRQQGGPGPAATDPNRRDGESIDPWPGACYPGGIRIRARRPPMKLEGRSALVTGGSRGIGRAIALELAREGADVAVNYLASEGPALEVAREIEKLGRRALAVRADVSDFPDTFRMAQEVLAAFGAVDILVNNAGINSDKTFVKM